MGMSLTKTVFFSGEFGWFLISAGVEVVLCPNGQRGRAVRDLSGLVPEAFGGCGNKDVSGQNGAVSPRFGCFDPFASFDRFTTSWQRTAIFLHSSQVRPTPSGVAQNGGTPFVQKGVFDSWAPPFLFLNPGF